MQIKWFEWACVELGSPINSRNWISCVRLDHALQWIQTRKFFSGQTEMQRVPGLHLSRSEVLGRQKQLQQRQKSYKRHSDDDTVFLPLDPTLKLAISNLCDFMLFSIKILMQKLIMKMSLLVDDEKAQSLPFQTKFVSNKSGEHLRCYGLTIFLT